MIVNYEESRIEELRKYDILDTLTETEYEDITKLASILCNAPVALISFVDSDRQWFKSAHGIDISETPREFSFCAHAIMEPDTIMIVEDSRLDVRFKDNPYVTGEPDIVFYAGMPLVTTNGHSLGTVCVLDTEPRVLNATQIEALESLSRQVMTLLNARKVNFELHAAKKQMEADIKLRETFTEELERQVIERTEKIAIQNADLEKMNKELQAFTYISSHDLQEPLRKIQFFIALLKDKENNGFSENAIAYMEKISRSSEKMRRLIADLLSYSRTTSSEKMFEELCFKDVIAEIEEDLAEEIIETNAQIAIASYCTIRVIPFQFHQLIYNLISNALKFAKPGVTPVINVEAGYHDAVRHKNEFLDATKSYFRIAVADNGIGFSNQYSEKIFQPFQRLHSLSDYVGTGIGLTIVKKIVENHKGHIFASGAENEGATFEIFIPEVN
jgi:signal transduction histidine kinase